MFHRNGLSDLAKVGWFLANKGGGFFKKQRTSMQRGDNNHHFATNAPAGMYNFGGEYAVRVGIPSKSGVAGEYWLQQLMEWG